jgi:sugar porter (SP) family MFS transporter
MGGVLAEPYFISLYTGYKYDYDTHTPIDVDKKHFIIPSSTSSLFTSILSLGTFLGALAGGDIADFIGRRPTIIGGCFVFAVGCILEIASTNQEVLFVFGRLIAGVGVGFISAVVILYMSEIAPKKVRGAMVSGYQFCITIGILLANVVVYASNDRSDTGSYRIPIGVQFAWALILGIGLFILPESPRFYVKKGRLEDAAKALAYCRGQPVESDYIRDELAEIVANHEYEQALIPQQTYVQSWTACLKGSLSKGNSPIRRTILGAGLQCAQQFTGINFIFYFGPQFFTQLGTIKNVFLISLITTLVNVLSTPISFFTIEWLGRRAILIGGGIGMVVCQFIIAIVGVTAGKTGSYSAVSSMIAFICINIAFFASTWGPTAWVVVGEIFPLQIRSRGVGISTASNWFWNTIIGKLPSQFNRNHRALILVSNSRYHSLPSQF